MFRERENGGSGTVVSVFCDPFAAAAAVRQLAAVGVAENEIDLIGFLGSHVPDWDPLLAGLGLSAGQADYYREEFEDGAVMLVIRAGHPEPKKSAIKVVKRHGGIVPEEHRAGRIRGSYESQ